MAKTALQRFNKKTVVLFGLMHKITNLCLIRCSFSVNIIRTAPYNLEKPVLLNYTDTIDDRKCLM